jgi:hypothetical protein
MKMLTGCSWFTAIQLSHESNSAHYAAYKSLDKRVKFMIEPAQLEDARTPDAML